METQARQTGDSGLRCPACEYNLTGVVEDRCPECGKAFDRAKLLAILAGAPAPIPVWDDASLNPFIRFIRVCFLIWFFPACFGRVFPHRYAKRSALWFRSLVLLATLVLLLPIGFVTHPAFYLVIGFALLVGVVVSEHLLTYAFGECLRPNQPRTGPMLRPSVSESWGGLVGFFRAFVLLGAPLLTTLFVTAPSHKLVSWEVLRAVMVVVGLWWWVALGSAIVVQRASVYRRIGLILLIPILAGLGLLTGMVAWLAGVGLFIPDFFE